MTLAQAAQKAIELGGKYDGHELPEDVNALTKTSVTEPGRAGPDGVRRATTIRATGRRSRTSPGSPKSKSMSRPASSTSSSTPPSRTSAR